MAKFNKVRHNHTGIYAESPQRNPLRWRILFKEEDGSFTPTSKEFKCKDFLNDLVAKYVGHAFKVYDFDWRGTDVNEEGCYLELKSIENADVFEQNIGSIKEFKGYGEELILEKVDAETYICFVPRAYFASTYTISLLSYLIRVSNVDVAITDWLKHPTKEQDNPFGGKFEQIMKGGLKPPIDAPCYGGKDKTTIESMIRPNYFYDIHNNGCKAWVTAIQYGM